MLKSITHSSFIYYDNKLKWKNCEKSFTRIKLCQNSAYKVCEALSLFSTVVTPQISGVVEIYLGCNKAEVYCVNFFLIHKQFL